MGNGQVVQAQSGKLTTSRFSHLLSLPEAANVGQAVNEAMRAIEKVNPDLADVLPKSYHILEIDHVSEPVLRSIGSNDLTVVSSTSGDRNVATPYEDLQDSVSRLDFMLANPPFNVSKIDKERLAGDPRYPFGIPRTDNGNYLWSSPSYRGVDC